MSGQKSIFEDERYSDFVDRFHASPLRFAVEVTGLAPSFDQEDLLNAIASPDAKVSVVSGTSTGKTAVFGRIVLWHMLCFPMAVYEGKIEIGSNTYVGAPRINQVGDGVWKEMNDARVAISSGPYAWINAYYDITKTRAYVRGFEEQWFAAQVAMQKGQSIGVAGKHRYWQLIIIDEAAGVSDEHFNVIDGTQTQPGNRTLLASQGVRNAGRFYETHHSLSQDHGGSWASLTFNSEHSPIVTKTWLRDREEESGGKNTIEYIIRVKGGFADNSGSNLLTNAELQDAFDRGSIIGNDEPYGIMLLADVAMGEYRDFSVALTAKVIGYGDFGADARRVEYIAIPVHSNSKDEITFAGDLTDLYGKLSNATLLVDNGGVGHAVNKLIEQQGVPVVRVDWGKPCFKKEYQNRFYNRRACAMVRWRDAVRAGRVSFLFPDGIDKKMRQKIMSQGSRLPYHFAEAGGLKYVMMKKEKMREEGIPSPDIIDPMTFPFLEDANEYIVADGAGRSDGSTAAEKAKEAVDEEYSDIE
ncbi:MAG: hypothetical protein H6937_07050 [Burkholderiales bacterium]|nr:hypothetical protein [Burkholderiales bacterium]